MNDFDEKLMMMMIKAFNERKEMKYKRKLVNKKYEI